MKKKIYIIIFCCIITILNTAGAKNHHSQYVIETDEGYTIGSLRMLEIPVQELKCPAVDDTILSDDPDNVLVMQLCRKVFEEEKNETENPESSTVTFYNPYIFLIEDDGDLKRYYFVLDVNTYGLYKLEEEQLAYDDDDMTYKLEAGHLVFDRVHHDFFTQSIITMRKSEEGYEFVSYEEPESTFLPGTVNEEIEGYYSGLTEEMWEEMADNGYEDGFPRTIIKRYLQNIGLFDVFIMVGQEETQHRKKQHIDRERGLNETGYDSLYSAS